MCVAAWPCFSSVQWWIYSQAVTKPCDIILALRAKWEQWEPSSTGLVGSGSAGTVPCPPRTHGRYQLRPSVGQSLFLAIPRGGFLKVWPKCHESATAAVQVAALPVPQFGQAKISPFEPSALSPWNTNCFPLPWRSHSLISLHPHLQLIPKRTGSVRNKASRRHST